MEDRITPAGAGKTPFFISALPTSRDHPRRCGENDRKGIRNADKAGSPPQVRGKLSHCACRELRTGITPAGAGKTPQRRKQTELFEDHPRRCGENTVRYIAGVSSGGSPPQVRGKLAGVCTTTHTPGITPAGAGKTSARFWQNSFCWDHPRRCGENRRASC